MFGYPAGCGFDGGVGVGDLGLVTSAAERAVAGCERVVGALWRAFGPLQTLVCFGVLGEGAATVTWEEVEVSSELFEGGGDLCLLVEQGSERFGWERSGAVRVVAGEFGLACERGSIDPATGDGLGEDVGGGLFVGGDDVGVVVVSSSGHGDVDAADVGWGVDQEDGSVDGAALGGVAGLSVGELDVVSDVVGGETGCAGPASNAEIAVATSLGDGPLVSVADHLALVGVELPMVAARRDLITCPEPVVAGVDVAA